MPNIDISSTPLESTKGFSISGNTGRFGTSVSAADVNNDGFSDLLVGTVSENKADIILCKYFFV